MLVPQAAGLLAFAALVAYVADWKLKLGLVPAGILGLSIFGVGLFAMLKLRGAPREMGFTFGLKFVSVTAYKILNVTLVLWLGRDFGLSDEAALSLIVGWSVFMSVVTILAGSITDALGLRRTLLIGATICVLMRVVMALSPDGYVAVICGLLPLAIGEALCTPVLVAALRRYSTASQRSVAFALFYALMNFGFMFGYFVFDGVRAQMLAVEPARVPLLGTELSPWRMLILVSMGIELLLFPLVLLLRPGVEMTDKGLVTKQEGHHYPGMGFAAKVRLTTRDAARDTVANLGALVASKGFGRLVAFLLMIGLLKVVFNAMDFVLPPFTLRELGEGAPVGRLNAINGILILVLAPAIGMLTRRFASYSMVILGGFITAGSFVFMALPPAVFQAAADGWLGKAIGHGYLEIAATQAVHPWFVMIFFWQVVFSIGEAFYSPRVYEYAASIAPKGQEASYASLSYIPLLIGKLITGAAFGGLLAKYCPEEGPRDPSTMWLIIGLLVLVAPAGLLILSRFIRVREEGREGS
jgi:MFS family permease